MELLFRYEWGGVVNGGGYLILAPPVPAALLCLSWDFARLANGDYRVPTRAWESFRALLVKVGYSPRREGREQIL